MRVIAKPPTVAASKRMLFVREMLDAGRFAEEEFKAVLPFEDASPDSGGDLSPAGKQAFTVGGARRLTGTGIISNVRTENWRRRTDEHQ